MNSISHIKLILAIAALISSAEAQATTCGTSSPQCCWVKRIWQLMGKTTALSSTSADGCCSNIVGDTFGIPGVTCTTSTPRKVTEINWGPLTLTGSIPEDIGKLVDLTKLFITDNNDLTGTIPSTIGSLTNLRHLWFQNNRLSGSIPSQITNLRQLVSLNLAKNQLSGSVPSNIGDLSNLEVLAVSENQLNGSIPSSIQQLTRLRGLFLHYNSFSGSISLNLLPLTVLGKLSIMRLSLTGTITASCATEVFALNTSIVVCGCPSFKSAPPIFPPESTSDTCLATRHVGPLAKRTFIFSKSISGLAFDCNKDSNGNPYQNCFSTMTKFCTKSTDANYCKEVVNRISSQLSGYWQNVRKFCGPWPFNGFTGNPDSPECTNANSDLIMNAYYLGPNNEQLKIDTRLTVSVRDSLWRNPALGG